MREISGSRSVCAGADADNRLTGFGIGVEDLDDITGGRTGFFTTDIVACIFRFRSSRSCVIFVTAGSMALANKPTAKRNEISVETAATKIELSMSAKPRPI